MSNGEFSPCSTCSSPMACRDVAMCARPSVIHTTPKIECKPARVQAAKQVIVLLEGVTFISVALDPVLAILTGQTLARRGEVTVLSTQVVDAQPVTTPEPHDRFKEMRQQLANAQHMLIDRAIEYLDAKDFAATQRLLKGLKDTLPNQ